MTDAELAASVREICGTEDNELADIRVRYDRYAIRDSEDIYDVYVQINKEDYITAVDSSAFLTDLAFWLKVDSGRGELYKYAKVNYCPHGLIKDGGYNYKLVEGMVVYAPQIEQPEDHNEMASQEEFFIATKNYEVGELISIQSRMYEATSVIPEGCKIVDGQNAVETTLEKYINKRIEEAINEKTNI